ncbi:hypothetical protein BC332_18277 [Capsicum chinense]|nr:hypothetical protein BC332_18277 [Capsicum chinense]
MVFSDDGNLPEFDFGTASGISSSSHRSDGSILGNRLQLSGSRILDTSKQPTRPVAPSVSVSIPRQMEEKLKSQSHAIPVADVQNERTNEPPKTLPRESSDLTSRMLPPLPTG